MFIILILLVYSVLSKYWVLAESRIWLKLELWDRDFALSINSHEQIQ